MMQDGEANGWMTEWSSVKSRPAPLPTRRRRLRKN